MSIEIDDLGGGIWRLRLNRPERRNAWSADCGEEMTSALLRIEADPRVRCAVLTGAGDVFCSGVDLRAGFERGPDGTPNLQGMHRRYFVPTILGIRNLSKPVIGAVNGPAIGFGASLALAPDFTVMAESATLVYGFVKLGLCPDSGSTAALPARAGRQRAMAAAMLGDPISATKAAEWGLVHAAVPDSDLTTEVEELAARLAKGPTRAYAAIKRAFNAQERPALAEQLEVEGELVQSLAGTRDFAEGLAAFAQRRAPAFVGV
ncbi:MAG: enoyl-CoA hydratase/isomerase family protein [Pseudonocardia sp.]|nr:enoyl-CoA hydratase/isomerase family protein [Pseudonocardia sp.]